MNQVKNIYLSAILICFSSIAMADDNVTKENNSTISTELSMEEQIKKALGEVEPMRVMESTEPRILSESEAKVLETDKPKVIKKKKVVVKKRIKRVKKQEIDMDSLPMAKTYPID